VEVRRLQRIRRNRKRVFIPYKKALIIQKENLFKKFSNDDRAWQRWAWIIERKFSEWNLKILMKTKR